jgi:hypothetical protein
VHKCGLEYVIFGVSLPIKSGVCLLSWYIFFVNFMLVNNVKLSCEIRCIKNLQPL